MGATWPDAANGRLDGWHADLSWGAQGPRGGTTRMGGAGGAQDWIGLRPD